MPARSRHSLRHAAPSWGLEMFGNLMIIYQRQTGIDIPDAGNPLKMKATVYSALLATISAACAFAQAPTPSVPTQQPKARPPWELEWAYLSKYRDADAKLGPPGQTGNRIIFLGDSITEGWGDIDGKFFAGRPYVNRGIGGQTTSQMLVRFREDVLALKPAVVLILGGTNDIAQNGGLTTMEAIEDNLQSMVELARLHGIRVVLASVL